MSNPTSNFGWQMPTPTDLVTDLPADFEVFGQAVDTSMADLKGGTTGQILSKATNTDMDFVWITNDQGDITGITATSPLTGGGTSGAVTVGIQSATTSQSGAVQLSDSTSTTSSVLAATPTAVKASYDLAAAAIPKSTVTAKGSIVAASASSTPAQLAVGNNGETLVADSSTSTGLRYQGTMAGGKNAIINGGFDYWQRGTSGFTFGGSYNADRWKFYTDGAGITATITQQALTAGSIVGVDSPFCWQWSQTVAGSGATAMALYTLIENVQTFAGQTTVFSFYAKSDATRTAVAPRISQNFGSGGSGAVAATITATGSNPTNLTTSWQRFSYTVAFPSITGKTIGTGSHLETVIELPKNTTQVTQVVGAQLEVGSVPTQFTRAGGTLQGELAACQRYFYRNTGQAATSNDLGTGWCNSTTNAIVIYRHPVTMRTAPTATLSAQTDFYFTWSLGTSTITASQVDRTSVDSVYFRVVTSGLTTGQGGVVGVLTGTTKYIEMSSEL